MNKPSRPFASLCAISPAKLSATTFKRQGFAATELVTRWTDIVGAEIAVHGEPVKIQWPRASVPKGERRAKSPATLVLRVEGPAALEIQHPADVILERVNRFFGWRAVERHRVSGKRRCGAASSKPPELRRREAARVAATLDAVTDDDLRAALARLGAADQAR